MLKGRRRDEGLCDAFCSSFQNVDRAGERFVEESRQGTSASQTSRADEGAAKERTHRACAPLDCLVLISPEVLEPGWLKRALSPAPDDLDFPARARYLADARDAHAAQLLRHLRRVAR